MRTPVKVVVALGACALIWLVSIQAIASLALRERAAPVSWMRLAPEPLARGAVALVDRGYPVPFALRLALARQALAAGDLALAAQRVERLPASRERDVLSGTLAQAKGEDQAAFTAFLRGGDLAGAQVVIDRLAARDRLAAAIALERRAIEALSHDPLESAAQAQAFWRLGQLLQAQDYELPIAQRTPLARQAARAYDAAVLRAPLSARYLLAAGSEYLNLNDAARARAYYERVVREDPSSFDGAVGMSDSLLRLGERAAARAWYERAKRLHDGPELGRLRAALGA